MAFVVLLTYRFDSSEMEPMTNVPASTKDRFGSFYSPISNCLKGAIFDGSGDPGSSCALVFSTHELGGLRESRESINHYICAYVPCIDTKFTPGIYLSFP
jgi:hypothetical protein